MGKRGILKKLNIIYAIVLVALLVITSIAFVALKDSAFAINNGNMSEYSNTYSVDEVKKIVVNVTSSDINIIPDDRADTQIITEGMLTENTEIDVKQGVLTIKEKQWFRLFDFSGLLGPNYKAKINIHLPEAYTGSVHLSNANGEIFVDKISIDSLRISNVSGDIKVTRTVTKDININSVSGEVNLENSIFNYIDVDTVSGNVNLLLNDLTKETNIDTISGDVDIRMETIADSKEFNIDFDSVSGDLELEYGVYNFSTAKHFINVSTVSGDLTVG